MQPIIQDSNVNVIGGGTNDGATKGIDHNVNDLLKRDIAIIEAVK